MWMSKSWIYGSDILLSIFAVYLFFYYFDIFFTRRREKIWGVVGGVIFVLWQIFPFNGSALSGEENIIITTIVTLIAVLFIYEGTVWDKCVFAAEFNAIWMLMETLCNYMLMLYCTRYAMKLQIGSVISKIFFFFVLAALKKVFSNDEIKRLPAKHNSMLVLIPMGSIYIMNNIFMLGYQIDNRREEIRSAVTVVILLGMNILIFYIYMKLADDLNLRRMTAVYEQQLELYEQHQKERELTTLQMRDVRHNMKNNLVSILAYAEQREYEKMIEYIHEIMEEGRMNRTWIANSGNIIVDSLVGYWYMAAQERGIECNVEINIPMIMPFKGADICLILGNLLENAVEAAGKVEGRKYINVRMKYDRENLLIFIANSYDGVLVKTKDNVFRSTKKDTENHGIGLPSVHRTVTKYNGMLILDDKVPGQFQVRAVLYGAQK